MTDKEQIIIDGVNVGGCKYLNTFSDCDGYHYYCDLADDIKNEYCEYYKDCYFKQLARKTTECEKYEQALDEIAAHYQKVIKNITNYDDSYDASISIKALHNISDIINKAKGEQ